jgi:predicted transcriptional regulator of viral defense system
MRAARQHAGVFSAEDVEREGLSAKTIYDLRDSGDIISVSRGLFQLVDAGDAAVATPDYAAIKRRVPKGVICLISALYHYGLTTEIPRKIYLAIDRNAHIPRIDYPPISIFRMSPKPFSTGIETAEIGAVKINIFSAEKSVADAFKYRNKIGLDTAVESLRNYCSRRNANPSKVLEMSRVCRVEAVIKPYLEALV